MEADGKIFFVPNERRVEKDTTYCVYIIECPKCGHVIRIPFFSNECDDDFLDIYKKRCPLCGAHLVTLLPRIYSGI